MIDKLIGWSLRYRVIVIALTAAFLVWGGFALRDVPLDVLPDLSAPTVTILVEGHGMAPTEMESLVTFPIEASLNGASGVRRVRSATAVGLAVIWAEFDWGQDIQRARQIVTEKLTLVGASLPPEVEQPFLAPVSSIMGEIMFVTLESDRHSPLDLRTVADNAVRRRLLAVPGVSQVIATGGGQKQYQVLVNPVELREYDVTLGQVEEALRRGNKNSSAGFRVTGGQEYLIQGVGRVSNEDEIGNIVIVARDARPILVRNVAHVQIGAALKRGEGSHKGSPAVILGIQKQPGANTLELTRQLDSTLDDIQRTLPVGMVIDKHVFRQADFIQRALDNLIGALRDGSLLVVLVVLVFLANLRASLITLVALPISLVAAVLGIKFLGFTLNSMSLGGLAIAVGELVDDAIIDVENVVRRLRENSNLPEAERLSAMEVVYRASREIRGSVVFATLIVILVFLPLFALESVEGRLLWPIGFAYIIALVASLVVALTVTPALCSILLPRARSILKGHDPWLIRTLKRIYRPLLSFSLNHSWMVLGASLLLVVAAGPARPSARLDRRARAPAGALGRTDHAQGGGGLGRLPDRGEIRCRARVPLARAGRGVRAGGPSRRAAAARDRRQLWCPDGALGAGRRRGAGRRSGPDRSAASPRGARADRRGPAAVMRRADPADRRSSPARRAPRSRPYNRRSCASCSPTTTAISRPDSSISRGRSRRTARSRWWRRSATAAAPRTR